MREFLKGLDLDSELIDTIMAEHGKIVTKDKEELQALKTEISNLKENSKDMADWKSKFEELDSKIKEQEAKKQAEEQDKILTNNILEVFGDRKFTSDYAKNGLLNDIKNGLNLPENKGKGIQELFDSLTKDKEGIFVNPNQMKDMASMGDSGDETPKNEIPMIF